MAFLAFNLSTIGSGALSDSFSLCQTSLWGIMIAVLFLFVRDKRQMARVGCWTVGMSVVGTVLAAYGTFSQVQRVVHPLWADFVVGLVLFMAGGIEMYRHELLKIEPAWSPGMVWLMRWFRRSTLPALAFMASIVQLPCASGPYPLLTQALSVRPGQMIEAYLLSYVMILFAPFAVSILLWYGMLSIPGVEQFKQQHRFLIRMVVGAAVTVVGVLLLWKTHAITLLPGIANIG